MGSAASCRVMCYQLGPTAVRVRASHPAVLNHLREFYTLVDDRGTHRMWTIDTSVGRPSASMTVDRWGVGHRAEATTQRLWLRCENPTGLAVTARKTAREVLVDFCEQRGYVMLHASAVADHARVIVVVGEKGSGKTTLALKAAIGHRMRYVANDHLIVYPLNGTKDRGLPSRLVLTSLPTPIPLKIGTYLDLESQLPPPWDTDVRDIEGFRRHPRAQVYSLDDRVFYTFRRLGHDNPVTVTLGGSGAGPRVLVVLAGYATGPVRPPEPVGSPVEALMPHVRTDWMFDPALNQRYLPRVERDRPTYVADARRLVEALSARATVVRWGHGGEPAPLLADVEQAGR